MAATTASAEPRPRALGPVQPGDPEECADQHLPLEPDVEDPRAVGEQPGERREQDRARQADRRHDQAPVEDLAHGRLPRRDLPRQPEPDRDHEDDHGLDDVDELQRHVGAELQPRAAGLQRGEEEAAEHGEDRVEGGEHAGHQPRPRRPGTDHRVVDVAVRLAEHEQRAGEPAQRAAQRHRLQDGAPHRHAAGLGEVAVEPGHAHRVAERRAAQQPRHRQRQHERRHHAEVQRRRVDEDRQLQRGGQLDGLRHGRAAGLVAQRIDGEVGREQRGDVVEQQRRDHQRDAEPRLPPGRQQRPRRPRRGARQHRRHERQRPRRSRPARGRRPRSPAPRRSSAPRRPG